LAQEITIREFRARDTEAVVTLWRECNLVVPWNDPYRDIQRKLRRQPELFLTAFLDGELVGTCMAGYEGHRGWINYLAVAPRHRRRGIGRLLMAEAEKRLRKLGCPKINLQVREGNRDVVAFYESIGFRVEPLVNMGKRLISDNPGERREEQ
jgi:ribosomal protein S18 acetylase RimI-like enzyme